MAWADKVVTADWFAKNAAKQFDVANLTEAIQAGARREVQRQILRIRRVDRLGDDVDDWFDAIADQSAMNDYIEDALGFAILYRWFVDVGANEWHSDKADQYRKMMMEAVDALLEYGIEVLKDAGSDQSVGMETPTWAI